MSDENCSFLTNIMPVSADLSTDIMAINRVDLILLL